MSVNGFPEDPISREEIPRNKEIRIPTRYNSYYSEPAADTDYFCFNEDTLLQWLNYNVTNPNTGKKFRWFEAQSIIRQLHKRKLYQWYNGYKSPFSHPPDRRSVPGDESPWPEGLRRLFNYVEENSL
jgi:hypothetical protein